MSNIVIVRAGQIYRAKGQRGFRYVRVEEVRRKANPPPYARLREVNEAGEYLTGKVKSGHRAGISRALEFDSLLTFDNGRWRLNSYYMLHQDV